MYKEQQHHFKSNSIISRLAVIVLSIVLLTGISLVPALQIGVSGQVQQEQQQQQPQQQQNQIGLSQVIKQIAQQVATANPGTNATNVYQILVQLAKQTAQTSSQAEAIKEIRQISSQVATYPFGTLSQVLSYFALQVASGNSNVLQIVQQTIQEKASSISNNITQSLSNVAVQQASGGSKNVNLVIRNAAQIIANRAGVPVEKVEAVIIQIALQFAQAQGRAITGQYIFQLANQIIQVPNGVLAQAILQLVNQDNVGKNSQTTTIIKNVIRISTEDDSDDGRPRPSNKQLALSISFAKDPIVRGNIQTITVIVSDAESNEKIQAAKVNGKVQYVTTHTETFSCITDASGKCSHSRQISGIVKPGTFTVSVQASASGYKPESKTTMFEVVAKNENITLPIANNTFVNDTSRVIVNDTDTNGNETGLSDGEQGDAGSNNGNVTLLLPPPPDPCIENPSLPECTLPERPLLCEENPTAEGCQPIDPCIEDPTAEGCEDPEPPIEDPGDADEGDADEGDADEGDDDEGDDDEGDDDEGDDGEDGDDGGDEGGDGDGGDDGDESEEDGGGSDDGDDGGGDDGE